ncbi:hypothetical protein TNCV_2086221 [Trichonephila clavipes]|nr:hypothetical protein TNCV_2086221 [Trichonephila clavipes]
MSQGTVQDGGGYVMGWYLVRDYCNKLDNEGSARVLPLIYMTRELITVFAPPQRFHIKACSAIGNRSRFSTEKLHRQ